MSASVLLKFCSEELADRMYTRRHRPWLGCRHPDRSFVLRKSTDKGHFVPQRQMVAVCTRQSATLGLVLLYQHGGQSYDTSECWQSHWARFQEDVVVNTQLSQILTNIITRTSLPIGMICSTASIQTPLFVPLNDHIRPTYSILLCLSSSLHVLTPLVLPDYYNSRYDVFLLSHPSVIVRAEEARGAAVEATTFPRKCQGDQLL